MVWRQHRKGVALLEPTAIVERIFGMVEHSGTFLGKVLLLAASFSGSCAFFRNAVSALTGESPDSTFRAVVLYSAVFFLVTLGAVFGVVSLRVLVSLI